MTLSLMTGLYSCGEQELDCSSSEFSATITGKKVASCGISDGELRIMASGLSPFTFTIQGIESNESGVFTDLSPGEYEILITDRNGCIVTIIETIEEEEGVMIEVVDVQPSGCAESQGKITVSAESGEPPFQYKLDNEPFQTSPTFSNLEANVYHISILDSDSCQTTQKIQVLSGVSLELDVLPIVTKECSTIGCHDGTTPPRLVSNRDIVRNAQPIIDFSSSGTMPPDAPLTLEEITKIGCWVTDDAPDN